MWVYVLCVRSLQLSLVQDVRPDTSELFRLHEVFSYNPYFLAFDNVTPISMSTDRVQCCTVIILISDIQICILTRYTNGTSNLTDYQMICRRRKSEWARAHSNANNVTDRNVLYNVIYVRKTLYFQKREMISHLRSYAISCLPVDIKQQVTEYLRNSF